MEPINAYARTQRLTICARMLMYRPETAELLDFEKNVVAEDTITLKPPSNDANDAATTDDAVPPQSSLHIVQNGQKIHAIADLEEVAEYLKTYPLALVLAKVVWRDKGCFICKPDVVSDHAHTGACYRIINSHVYRRAFGCKAANRRVAHALKEGDRIKLGRATLVVRHLARKPANSLSYIHEFMAQPTEEGRQPETSPEPADETSPEAADEIAPEAADETSPEAADVTSPEAADVTSPEPADEIAPDPANETAAPENAEERVQVEDIAVETVHRTISNVSTVMGPDSVINTQRSVTMPPVPRGACAAPEQDADQGMCRICLEGEESGSLVVPCKCNGSMKYVHLACVRTWIQGRLNVKDEHGQQQLAFFLKNLKCELCGVPYPSYIDVDSVWTEFLGIEEPSPPYAILEPENANHTGLHVASLSTASVSIGRNGSSDVVLPDISVSRCHAMMHYREGHFVIEDKGSKFGTLVQLADAYEIRVEAGTPIALKIGTDVLCIEAKIKRRFGELCCAGYSRRAVSVVI
ncbi:seroreactive antigen BMN1-9B, putative [Babesia bigemina]|uniref:Seroreactive antigen BMN1-9B, putative n=1 Tax=Babesia bigemina TaxID=5866 RepID=A0A061D826_BABBI|nr:seroreactive antigen BMN1-9B, putative [Babesia bigemina]CDR95079.1 seroreactive antigen BMN1-9B, putative [Babesia bigemina]|eukprot:XP_012767265.1 seroreactive antigen BMN1-9B, putative [Babesia bigemina]